MRHCRILAIVAMAALIAVPDSSDARPRFSLFGAAAAPLRMVMRGLPGIGGTRFHHRQTAMARSYAPDAGHADAGFETDRTRRAPDPVSFNAYEDIIGYALWPDEYAGRFWARSYGDIMKAVLSPSAAAALATERVSEGRARVRHHRVRLARAGRSEPESAVSVTTASMCAAKTEAEAGMPIERVEQAIELSGAQRVGLNELRAAVSVAVSRGRAACRDVLPPTPASRLKAATDGLLAIRDADILFRTPLVNFYATLTDVQKVQLSEAVDKAGNARSRGEAVCSATANDLPVGEIERSVKPTQEQHAGLEALRGISSEMSRYLANSCPHERPSDPIARLDAAGDRVSALLYAAISFDQVLNGFYLELGDDQKKHFDSLRRR